MLQRKYIKEKKNSLPQLVSETILTLRKYLIQQKIDDLSVDINALEDSKKENSLQDIVDYITLKKILSEKLNRVLN